MSHPMAVESAPAQGSAPAPRRRRIRWRLIGSGVALAILFFVLPLDELRSAFSRIPPAVYALSVPLFLTLHLLGIAKWRLMIGAAGGDLRIRDAVRCYYYGLFGNTFLPSVVGGDMVRAGLALRLAGNPTGVVVGSVVDRTLDVVALATVAGLGVLWLPGVLDPRSRTVFWVLLGVMAAGLVCLAAAWTLLPAQRLPYRLRRLAVKTRRSIRMTAANPGRAATALALGIGLQLALVSLNAWLGAACGIDIAFGAWLFAWPMAKLSALIPLTQGGLGVREAALAGLLSPFGVEAVLAVAAGLVFQAVVISGGLAGGGIAAVMGRADKARAAGPGGST